MLNAMEISKGGMISTLHTPLLASFGLLDWTPVADDFINNFVQRAQSLLIEQFEDSRLINDLVEVIVAPLQEIERVFSDMSKCRDLKTMGEDRLDIAGEIVGVLRGGLSDNAYRELIALQAFLNRSNGEPETLILAAKLILKATDVQYSEQYPAKVLLHIVSLTKPSASAMAMVQRLALGGVKILFSWSPDSDPDFAFASEGGLPEEPNTAGLAELPASIGGGRLTDNI